MSFRVRSVDELPPEVRTRLKGLAQPTHPWRAPQTNSEKAAPLKRRNKFGSQPVFVDGHRFPSKLEGDRYVQLKDLRATGEYRPGIGRLVTFHVWPVFLLPGGVKAILDSCQVWQDGERVRVVYEDAKGRDNQASKNKRKMIEALYGIEVQLWPPK